jgi:hypothetical protein
MLKKPYNKALSDHACLFKAISESDSNRKEIKSWSQCDKPERYRLEKKGIIRNSINFYFYFRMIRA